MIKYAVLFNRDLPEKERDPYIPLAWPMTFRELKKDEITRAGETAMTVQELAETRNLMWEEYQVLQDLKAANRASEYLRVNDLLADEFKKFHPSKIDFTMHLRAGVNLEKRDVVMLKNGRPVKTVYYFNNIKICEILFEFEADVLNFMTRRVKRLGYYALNDIIPEHYVIEDLSFSGENPYQHQKRLEERTWARGWIVDSLRADMDRFLTASATQNPTASAALAQMVNAFWVEYGPHMDAFISAGGTFLRSKFATETKYPFLDGFVAPGVTAKMYIVDKLTY